MAGKSIFTRSIVLLSLVSLFNDIASEMLYPIMPVYLASIGFTAFYIGLLEGVAEAVVGLSKGYFGNRSDATGNRVGYIRWGYLLSAISKPMLGLFTSTAWIFLARTSDRLGKGIRTNARDALLADESHDDHRGKVFGFHRALDTIGAAIGPLLAIIYLSFYPGNYRTLFFIAFVPSVIAVYLSWKTKQKTIEVKSNGRAGFFSYFGYWKKASPTYRKMIIGFVLFAIFNASDAFIFLLGKQNGLTDTTIISAYIFFNLIYALFAYPFGKLADRVGMKFSYIIGLVLFASAYMLFPFAHTLPLFFTAFFIYGLYMAATEGISKAWISKVCSPQDKATALGFYSSIQSIIVLTANITAGLIWMNVSPFALFYASAGGAVLALIYFLTLRTNKSPLSTQS